jgi:hypothetical protein
MKSFLLFISVLSLLANLSCKEEVLFRDDQDKLIGAWVFDRNESSPDGDISVLLRNPGLDSSKYGYIFLNEGKLIERKNSGWCGTPPISYANFPGTWEFVSDSLLEINVAYWGGMTDYALKIVSVGRVELKLRYLYPL